MFLADEAPLPSVQQPTIAKVAEAGALRKITIGARNAAEAPCDSDFDNAARYVISTLPAPADRAGRLLKIEYRGDVARLYYNGKLLDDNFYYGRPFVYGLWRLPDDCTELELRVLPLQPDMPVYFPAEADTTPGEEVVKVEIL